jgi:hypothetical protein
MYDARPPWRLCTREMCNGLQNAMQHCLGVGTQGPHKQTHQRPAPCILLHPDNLCCEYADTGSGLVYTATIPYRIYAAGDVVRWYVECEDEEGRKSRDPPFIAPDDPEYYGTRVSGGEPVDAADLWYSTKLLRRLLLPVRRCTLFGSATVVTCNSSW